MMLSLLLTILPALAAAVPASTYPYLNRSPATASIAPLHTVSEPIPEHYIVVLKQSVDHEAMNAHMAQISLFASRNAAQSATQDIKNVYLKALKGYSGRFDEETLSLIRAAPEVDYVEQDQPVWTTEVQNGAPWGLARISHRKKLRFGTFQEYIFDGDGGEGVDVYVIDTGINIKHVSFEGRASWGHTMPKNDVDEDGNGHGTHCAGTIASKDYGVAKKAHVIAVKVLGSNGSGSMSDVTGGVDWAATAAAAKAKSEALMEKKTGVRSTHKGSVANMSLGGGKSRALDDAINHAVDSGLHIAVAAGNDNKDACNYSPAGAEKAVTVGASTITDTRAYFSNFGKCVDVFGPGLNIKSTWNTGPRSTNTISGTSMASPHVAGLLAYLLSLSPSKKLELLGENAMIPAINVETMLPTESNPTFSALLTVAKKFLPSYFFANPVLFNEENFAPIPVPSPAALKKLLLQLSSPNLLEEVGEKSPNLLIFNNFTSNGLLD